MQYAGMYPTERALSGCKELLDMAMCLMDDQFQVDVPIVHCELLTNAINANKRSGGKTIIYALAFDGDQAEMVVQDEGLWLDKNFTKFEPRVYLAGDPPDALNLRGRGILLARNHCDDLTYQRCKKGFLVRARWRKATSNIENLIQQLTFGIGLPL